MAGERELVWQDPANVSEKQTMTFRVAPGASGALDADALGRQLSAMCRLWIAAANTHSDLKWRVVLLNAKSDRKGGVSFRVALAAKKSEVDKLRAEGAPR